MSGPLRAWTLAGTAELSLAGGASAVPVDWIGSSPSISGPTSLHIDDISIVGSSDGADFDWKDSAHGFQVPADGEESSTPGGFVRVSAGAFSMGSSGE